MNHTWIITHIINLKKYLQTRTAFEKKLKKGDVVSVIHSQIHNLYSKIWCGYIIVLIYHILYMHLLYKVSILIFAISLGSAKGRHRFLLARSWISEVYLVKYYLLKTEGKLEEINVSAQVTKNVNAPLQNHFFFPSCPDGFIFLQSEVLKLATDRDLYVLLLFIFLFFFCFSRKTVFCIQWWWGRP